MRALLKKAPIYLVVGGMFVVIASFVPLARGLYQMLFLGHDIETATPASFLSVVVFSVFGILLFLTGAIQWIRAVAMVPIAHPLPGNDVETDSERWVSMSCHLSALFGYVIPFGHIIAPFAVWAYQRQTSSVIDREGRTSLNFQITITVFTLVSGLLCMVFVGVVMLLGVIVFHFLSTLYVALRVKRGNVGHYPVSLEIF